MCWHLHSLAFDFQGFGNAEVSCVSELKPLSLLFSLSAPPNHCIYGGFVGVRTPQMAQPCVPSTSVCSGWDQPLQFALILGEEGGEEGPCHLQVLHPVF